MSLHAKIHNNVPVTTSGSSAVFKNPGSKRHVLAVVAPTAPTGTSPTLTYAVQVSSDGVSFAQKGAALATLAAAGSQRTVYGPGTTQGAITEPFIKVVWVIGGSVSPTFPGVVAAFTGVDC